MRWHYRDPLLAWLFPVAYGCHVLEEWFGGFPEWFAAIRGVPLPSDAFILINAVALIVMIGATYRTIRDERHGWMGIGVATVVEVNALLHVLASISTGTYSPGLFTSVVLYMPLGQLTLLRAWGQATRSQFGVGVLAGCAAHAFVSAIALLTVRE